VKPTALIPIVADLSQINASSLTVKAFIDIQDDNLPKLIVCQSLAIAVGVTVEQFGYFLQQAEEQMSMIILEAHANDMLFVGEPDEGEPLTNLNVPILH
jgi:hypothetical protein